MADPFINQLKRLCVTHRTRAKWVFVPTHALGRTIGDRLVLTGSDWANLRFVTPLDIALRMGAPFLVERGIDPSEEGLGPALIMRLLMDLPGSTSYFRPLANQPQLAMALWSTIRELRMAGVRADHLEAKHLESADKHAELQGLLAAYEAFLGATARGDQAVVYREALEHLDWCPIQASDCWTEWPEATWSPLQRRLISRMPGERLVPDSLALSGATIPRRRCDDEGSRRSVQDDQAHLAYLREPDQAKTSFGATKRYTFFNAGGPEAEVEEVFRRILASGTPLDEVEIACSSDTYPSLIWEKALRYEWPVTLAEGVPATLSRPGRALLGFSHWIEDDFSAGRLGRLLESGDVWGRARPPGGDGGSTDPGSHEESHSDRRPPPGRAARLLIKAQAAWGRDTYRLSLGQLSKALRTRAERGDISADEREIYLRRADEADVLAAWINRLIQLVPMPGEDGKINLQDLVHGAERFLEDTAARASAFDAAAATRIGGAIAELRALGEFRCGLDQGLRFLRERVEGLSVGADRPRPGHLHVSTLRECALAGRRLLFVIGLEEGRAFSTTFEDPILLDHERTLVHGGLRTSTDRIDEAVFSVVSRLASASALPDTAICFSYSCRDLRQFRETHASWLMLQAYRVGTGNPSVSYKELQQQLGTPKSCVPASPEDALGIGRWWLHGAKVGGEVAREAVLRQFPALAAGIWAEEARASAQFTEFDGYVPDAGPVLDPAAPGKVVSPTQLESVAKCPFRFFLERGLRINAIESGERSREVWLSPLIRGQLLHDLYAESLRRCRKADRRPTISDDREWLIALGRTRLAELKETMPAPSVEVEELESEGLLDDLDLFLRAECELDLSRRPLGFEVSFGQSDDGEAEPLARAEPIEIKVGSLTFRLAGRVDRVDRIDGPRGTTFRIVDYKTGSYWADDWKGTFAGGRMLQHALYGLAVAELLRLAGQQGEVADAEYYFSSRKGRQHRTNISAQPTARVAAVLTDLREVVASGLFIHTPTDTPCKFCDYQHACGKVAAERATTKLLDPALAPYRRLAAHD